MEDVENTRRPEEMDLSGKSYYLDVSLEEAENNIHACLRDAARNVIATGHYLKVIRDKELYREAGYENIWDYAAEKFGFSNDAEGVMGPPSYEKCSITFSEDTTLVVHLK